MLALDLAEKAYPKGFKVITSLERKRKQGGRPSKWNIYTYYLLYSQVRILQIEKEITAERACKILILSPPWNTWDNNNTISFKYMAKKFSEVKGENSIKNCIKSIDEEGDDELETMKMIEEEIKIALKL